MQGKELLKYIKGLPEHEQNKILVDTYWQIAAAHDSGRAFAPFTWKDCSLDDDGGRLTINASTDYQFCEEVFQRNLHDYAKVIYCLTTGSKSAESMSWDAGRKIQSSVLREIVLTVCGRNHSVEPLLIKLRQQYTDEDTFFNGYTTVDEKEGREAAARQRRIDAENRAGEIAYSPIHTSIFPAPKKSWFERIGIFILMALCVGGYKACQAEKKIKGQQAVQRIEVMQQERREFHETLKGVTWRAKPSGSENTSEKDN
ncbi:MAG: hypothetical protein NC338_07205 [Firmicutes bacterium]|nr:hypothetical protein [Bacillota bacterium]MCM1401782.1 hypothetical protein [Bacteroides sp.]MCM1477650.1 hypothetical protein [Bacteroides sp.]